MGDSTRKPIVSIIVPVYNAEKYLGECLDSLVKQTLGDIEIVAVDDGSTDSSAAILANYAQRDSRVRVIPQENGGVSRARNAGLEAARGEYVLFVDSDDYVRLDACEFLVNRVSESGADIVVFGGKTFPTKRWADDSFAKRNRICRKSEIVDALFSEAGGVPLMCNKLYSTELLRRIDAKLPVDLSLGEDHVFQLRVFPHAKCVEYSGEVLYFYRNHEGSSLDAEDEVRDERIVKHLDVVRAIASDWKEAGLLAERGSELLAWLVTFLHNDMAFVSFNVREQVSRDFDAIVHDYFTKHDIDKLNDTVWRKLDDMLFSAHAYEAEPIATFVVVSATDGTIPSRCIDSILNQTEQRLRCIIDSRCNNDEVEQVIARDRRCSVGDVSSLEVVLASVRSPYLLFSPTNCRYRPTTVERAVREMERLACGPDADLEPHTRVPRQEWGLGLGACDILMFDDHSGRIKRIDPYERIRPPEDELFNIRGKFAFNALRGWGHSVFSLTPGNRMYSTDFLTGHIPQNGCAPYEAAVQAVLATQFAYRIANSSQLLFAYGMLEYHERNAPWAVADTIAAFVDYRNHIEGSLARGFDEALLKYCLLVDQTMTVCPCNESVGKAILAAFDAVEEPVAASLPENDQALMKGFTDDAPADHALRMYGLSLREAEAREEDSLRTLEELEIHCSLLYEEIGEVYDSISYKVGRIVTWPLRTVYYGLKRVMSRRG